MSPHMCELEKFTAGSVASVCTFGQWKMLDIVSLGCYTSDSMCQENKLLQNY